MKSNEGPLNKEAPAPAPYTVPSTGSQPNAPTLGPRKRARDSDPDPYISVKDVPDLRLDNEPTAQGGAPSPVQGGAPSPVQAGAPTPVLAPAVGSSPKAPRLDSSNIGQGGVKVNDNPNPNPNVGR